MDHVPVRSCIEEDAFVGKQYGVHQHLHVVDAERRHRAQIAIEVPRRFESPWHCIQRVTHPLEMTLLAGSTSILYSPLANTTTTLATSWAERVPRMQLPEPYRP